jgi:hypothetical protein
MNKSKIGIFVLFILLIILLIAIIYFFSKEKNEVKEEENIDLGRYLQFFEQCNSTENENKIYCPEIPREEVMSFLRLAKDLKGIKICDDELCTKLYSDCEKLDGITFISSRLSGGTGPTHTTISSYKCEDEVYLVDYSSPPPKEKVWILSSKI